MMGTFELITVGRFVISGDTPEALLWDLFTTAPDPNQHKASR